MKYFTKFIVLGAASLAMAAAPALAIDKNARGAEKLDTSGRVAKALGAEGKVRVIVTLAAAKTGEALDAELEQPETRAAAMAGIAQNVGGAIGRHFGAATTVNGQALTRFKTLNGFAVTVTERQLRQLLADPAVAAVEHDMQVKALLDTTTATIGMPAAWTAGLTGVNRTVVVIDTGVDTAHPFITPGRVVREACFLVNPDCPNKTNEQTGAGASFPVAGEAHGTHVAGIAMGKNAGSAKPASGVAPMAKLFSINVFEKSGTASTSSLIRALEYVEDERIATPKLNISAINMSLGGGSYTTSCNGLSPTFTGLVQRLRYTYNVPLVAAAGNNGSGKTMSWPACHSEVVSVGATNRAGNAIASYSELTTRTSLLAPGGDIDNGGMVVSSVLNKAYTAYQGTSMAAPHVAGAITALRAKFPWTQTSQLEDALYRTGVFVTDNRAEGGYGVRLPRISVEAARAFLAAPTPPANDSFAKATPIANITAETWGTTTGGTREPGEPAITKTTGPSSWWTWKAPATGAVILSTFGSNFDTVLGVYTGETVNALKQLAINDNASAETRSSQVKFQATAGATYRIAVSSRHPAITGRVRLTGFMTPGNDDFVNARPVSVSTTAPTTVTGSSVNATMQPGEPTYHGINSIWWKFVAPTDGRIIIDTEGSMAQNGSALDTTLGIYTGKTVSALTYAGGDTNSGAGFWSKMAFYATKGTTYYVAVGAFDFSSLGPEYEQGSIRVNFSAVWQ